MIKFVALIFASAFIALTGIGKDETGVHVKTSREVVEQALGGRGVQIGCGADRGRIVTVETRKVSLKGEATNEDAECVEEYDFPDNVDDDFETKRFKAVWKAYANGLARIAEYINQELRSSEEVRKVQGRDDQISTSISTSCDFKLDGVVTVTTAESFNGSEYEYSVAVCQSEKRKKLYNEYLAGRCAESSGRCSLKEFIDLKSDTGIICPQSFIDNEGIWWRIAGVPEEAEGWSGIRQHFRFEKAKRYAFEAAIRTVAVKVSSKMSTSASLVKVKNIGGDESIQKLVRKVEIAPLCNVSQSDLSRVKWFELERTSYVTGKRIRLIVCAIREDAGKVNGEQGGSGGLQIGKKVSAMDQAKAFLLQKQWQVGREFVKENKFAVAIGGASFKYNSQMDDADFARKRYVAVQQALMETAMNVAFTYQTCTELREVFSSQDGQMKKQQAIQNDLSEEAFRAFTKLNGNMLSLCDDVRAISEVQTIDGEWAMRVSSIGKSNGEIDPGTFQEKSGNVRTEMPLLGLSVVRQFESLIDDVYQVVFVVRHRPQDGPKEMMSFDRESRMSVDVGKLSLPQWIESQDYGLMAGPRKYIDDKGCLWAIGIVPSAECHRPFGSSLDRMARECAAFAFGGNVKAKYEKDEVFQHSGTYTDRKVSVIYEAALKTYPQELEAYSHRPYVHPLTGRKGVVAICALRQGHSDWQQKRMAREIEENIQQQKEKERQEGMRAAMKKIKGESAK